jgi:hypothetical protein
VANMLQYIGYIRPGRPFVVGGLLQLWRQHESLQLSLSMSRSSDAGASSELSCALLSILLSSSPLSTTSRVAA